MKFCLQAVGIIKLSYFLSLGDTIREYQTWHPLNVDHIAGKERQNPLTWGMGALIFWTESSVES